METFSIRCLGCAAEEKLVHHARFLPDGTTASTTFWTGPVGWFLRWSQTYEHKDADYSCPLCLDFQEENGSDWLPVNPG